MAFGTGSFGFFSAGLGGPPPPGTGGIYGGSGVIPTGVLAQVTDTFTLESPSGYATRGGFVFKPAKTYSGVAVDEYATINNGARGWMWSYCCNETFGFGSYTGNTTNQFIFNRGSLTNGFDVTAAVTIHGGSASPNVQALRLIGSGSTSATGALLVENSSATNLFEIKDNGDSSLSFAKTSGTFNFKEYTSGLNMVRIHGTGNVGKLSVLNGNFVKVYLSASEGMFFNPAGTAAGITQVGLGVTSDSHTILNPRISTADITANITTPLAGMQVYDSTLNKLQYYDSASWITLGATELLVANTLYVDGTNGDDDTAVSGDMSKPYATITGLTGANASAVVGDLIHIRPGTYVENDILKDGVAYYFDKGAIFHPTSVQQDADNAAILTAEAYTHKVIVLGYGEFISDYAAGGISNACIRIISDNAYLEFFQCTWTGGSASGGQKGVVYLSCTGTGFDNLIELNGNVTKTTDTGGSGGNGWYCVFIIGGLNYKINGVFTNLSNANNSTGILINGGSSQNVQCTGRIFVSATTATCYGFKSTNNYTTFSWDGDIEIETQANGYSLYADTGYSGECLARGTFRGAIYCGLGGLEGRGMYISGLQIVIASPSGYAFQLVDDAYIVVDLVISSSIAVFNVTFGALLFQGCATIHANNQKFLTQTGGKFMFEGMMENIARRLTNSTITGGECVIESDFVHWGQNYPTDEYLFYVDGGTLRIEGCRIQNNQTTNGSGVIEYVSGQLILNGATLVSTAVDVTTFSIKVTSALNYIGYNDSYANMPVGGGGSLTNLITGGGSIVVDTDVQ